MVNIAICDDDVKFAGRLEEMLIDYAKKCQIKIKIEVFLDGLELLESIKNQKELYDIIFLDIEMKDLNGIEVAKKIRSFDERCLIIYVTSYQSYAIEAYEVQPFRFIAKPINESILYKYWEAALDKVLSDNSTFQFKYKREIYKIRLSDIMYFQSKMRVIYVYMNNGSVFKFYDKMNNVENYIEKENKMFWRIHQSFLVNSHYILKISHDCVELNNHQILFISDDRKKVISKYYRNLVIGED